MRAAALTFVASSSPSGAWVHGFAYGHVKRRGWVQNGWLYRP